jgi:hypothetical protein
MSAPTRNPFARLGLWIKRTLTFIYGPAEMRDETDPIVEIDRELGRDTHPQHEPPKLSERQQSYQDLPRGTGE